MAIADSAIRIPAEHLRAAFAARGVLAFHYAATVDDACRFLRAGVLLTSGEIFLDAADMHARARRPNKCGPVLFVIAAAILSTPAAGDAGVCNCAPSAWPSHPAGACWFANADAVVRDFDTARHEHMLVLHAGGNLPFAGFLAKIIVDNPCALDDAGDGHARAMTLLRQAMLDGGVTTVLASRDCPCECECRIAAGNHFSIG